MLASLIAANTIAICALANCRQPVIPVCLSLAKCRLRLVVRPPVVQRDFADENLCLLVYTFLLLSVIAVLLQTLPRLRNDRPNAMITTYPFLVTDSVMLRNLLCKIKVMYENYQT